MIRLSRHRWSPIGLDIDSHRISALQLSGDQLSAVLSLPRSDTGDALSPGDVQRLVAALRRCGFHGRRVVLCVPAGSEQIDRLELPKNRPGVPFAQIAAAEMARIHRCDPQEVEVAFWNLPISTGLGTSVLAAACLHQDAEALLDPLEAHGLLVQALDIRGWALARAIADWGKVADNITAAVDLGWDASTFVLLHEGTLVYQRTLETSGLQNLADSIQSEHGFTAEVIEHVLYELGCETDRCSEPGNARLHTAVAHQIEAHTEAIAHELNLSMQYASDQYPDADLQHLLLTGNGVVIPGLAEQLGQLLDTTVVVVCLGELTSCPDPFATESLSTSLPIALGLAKYDQEVVRCLGQ